MNILTVAVLLVGVMFASACYANPILINFSHDELWGMSIYGPIPLWIPIAAGVAAIAVEFLVLRTLVGGDDPKIQQFGRKFAAIHVVTFPLTQVVSFFMGPITEVMPIVLEKLFYSRDPKFKAWGRKGWFVVVLGNLCSWLIGFTAAELYWS